MSPVDSKDRTKPDRLLPRGCAWITLVLGALFVLGTWVLFAQLGDDFDHDKLNSFGVRASIISGGIVVLVAVLTMVPRRRR